MTQTFSLTERVDEATVGLLVLVVPLYRIIKMRLDLEQDRKVRIQNV